VQKFHSLFYRKLGIHKELIFHTGISLGFQNIDILSFFSVKGLMRLLGRIMNKTTFNVFVPSDAGGGVALCPLLQGKIKLCVKTGLS